MLNFSITVYDEDVSRTKAYFEAFPGIDTETIVVKKYDELRTDIEAKADNENRKLSEFMRLLDFIMDRGSIYSFGNC